MSEDMCFGLPATCEMRNRRGALGVQGHLGVRTLNFRFGGCNNVSGMFTVTLCKVDYLRSDTRRTLQSRFSGVPHVAKPILRPRVQCHVRLPTGESTLRRTDGLRVTLRPSPRIDIASV